MPSSALALAVCLLVAQVPQSGDPSSLKAPLASDKPAYAPGEPITFTLRIVNSTPRPVRLSFRTAQRFGRLFTQVLGQETLSPSGGEFLARATAEGRFSPGIYTVKGTIPAMEGTLSASTTVTVQ